MRNRFLLGASVKALDTADLRGSFQAIASTEAIDRDGEVVDAKAFEPLPESVPVHAFHDFHNPVGRGVPRYDGKELVIEGQFASTQRAQEIRQLVTDGAIQHMSVGFMPPERADVDGVTHITRAELLEVSFTSVPSNREAAILAAKSADMLDIADAYEAFVKALRSAQVLVPIGDVEATATDPEQPAAAQAAADVPAEVPVDRAQAALGLLDALTH